MPIKCREITVTDTLAPHSNGDSVPLQNTSICPTPIPNNPGPEQDRCRKDNTKKENDILVVTCYLVKLEFNILVF